MSVKDVMEIDLAAARIVTVRELTRDTAAVLREINENNEPAIITRHGRFVALLTPLEGAKLEVRALQELSSELPDVTRIDLDDDEPSIPLDRARRRPR